MEKQVNVNAIRANNKVSRIMGGESLISLIPFNFVSREK
jgi:hypothetical protein